MSEIKVFGLDEEELENTPVDEIESESINLINVAIDGSGSMYVYLNDMKDSLAGFKDALENSKEADEILVSRADFRDSDVKIGGYKKISEFSTNYEADGATPLYDVIVEGSDKLIKYMDTLRQNGMRVKAVFAVFSDGLDNQSKYKVSEAVSAIQGLNDREIVTAFVSFGNEAVGIGNRLKFRNILNVNSSATELRRAFSCLSKSVIENSKSVISKTDSFFI